MRKCATHFTDVCLFVCPCVCVCACVHGADNPMGDTGVRAVVRMAATTPALETLDLNSACK